MIVEPNTDLGQFAGQRVTINHVRGALIADIRHCADSTFPELRDGVGGTCIEDRHGECQGGSTAFWWPYGTDLAIKVTA